MMCLLFKQDKQLRYYGPSWQLNILKMEDNSYRIFTYFFSLLNGKIYTLILST